MRFLLPHIFWVFVNVSMYQRYFILGNKIKNENRRTRLLCWIMADPDLLRTKVIHQKQTWARRCEKLLVMSSKQDDDFPAVGWFKKSGRASFPVLLNLKDQQHQTLESIEFFPMESFWQIYPNFNSSCTNIFVL